MKTLIELLIFYATQIAELRPLLNKPDLTEAEVDAVIVDSQAKHTEFLNEINKNA